MSQYQNRPIHPLERPPGATESPPTPEPRPTARVKIPTVKPLATYGILAILVIVYLAELLDPRLMILGRKDNTRILLYGETWRLMTAMFLHANPLHIIMNGLALYSIGRTVEALFGHVRFLLIYFLGGLAASLASLALTPAGSVGASGAIFAIFGAEILFFVRHQRLFGRVGRRILNDLIAMALLNLAIGLSTPMIDNWGHIGGFLGGLILALPLSPRLRLSFEPLSGRIVARDENPMEGVWWCAGVFALGLLALFVLIVIVR